MRLAGILCFGLLFLSGCLPKFLQKYQDNRGPAGGAGYKESPKTATPTQVQTRAYALDRKSMRFQMEHDQVWDTALSVLLQNYNLTIVNKESGVITTEWDSFYLEGKLYRNKLSMLVRRTRDYRNVDVMVYNNVEVFRQEGYQHGSGVWLPADLGYEEVGRVFRNMSMFLGEANPTLHPDMMAKAQPSKNPLLTQ